MYGVHILVQDRGYKNALENVNLKLSYERETFCSFMQMTPEVINDSMELVSDRNTNRTILLLYSRSRLCFSE
jgi:hypothetical protein